MKRTYLFGTMMAFSLAAASVGAQQDRPTSASEQPSKNVVVTGCLKSGSSPTGSTATGTAGTTGTSGTTASGSGSFILADAKVTPATAATSATGTTGSTAGTTGTSGTAPSADADKDKDKAKSFALVGGTSSELQGYVNSKVEITGTIDPSASGSAPSVSASTPSTTGATASMAGMSHAGDHAKLRVTSVRQVAASCDPAQR